MGKQSIGAGYGQPCLVTKASNGLRGTEQQDCLGAGAMDTNPQRILFICSPSKTVHALSDMVKARLMELIVALTLQDAEPILARVALALVVCASQLLDGTYRDVLQTLAREKRTVPVLVVSLMSRDEECEEARRLGAADCVPRPLTCQEVQAVVDKVFILTSCARSAMPG